MHDEDETEDLPSLTPDHASEKQELADPPSAGDRFHVTPTYYQLLAKEIVQDLEKIAAKIPKLEVHQRADKNAIRAHSNIPLPFLGTAVVAAEDMPDVEAASMLVPADARETLQFLDAFRIVDDRVGALKNQVRGTMMSRRTVLALQALQVYSTTRSLARDPRNTKAAHHAENLQRDLGKRGRPRKKRWEE
jgi:hypothetical protein